jgi:hypothetical protein
MHIPHPFRSFSLKPLELNRTGETWRKCGPEIPALVVFEVCLAIAGCAGGTASTPGGNPVSTIPAPAIPAPTISAISPASNLVGSPAFTLTVSGANFLPSTVVNFGGTAVATTFASSTQLTAAIPATAIASAGTATVTVTNGGTLNTANFSINAQLSVQFTPTGNMTVPRANSTATLLPDGRVLIVGGEQSGTTAELYNPATGTFQASSANIVGTPLLLNNGELLVLGTGAELYDPKTDSTTPTGHLLVDQGIYAATVLGNGKALVLGTHDAEIYDPVTGSFASAGPYAAALGNLLTTAITLADGRVLVLGSNPPQLFDPATNSFSTTGSLSATGLYGMDLYSATLLKDGRVLVAGGMGDWRTAAAVLYDPKTGTFTTTGSMNDARDAHAAALLADGHVLILGGDGWACSATGCYFSGSLSSAELYDPATGTFSRAGYMNEARTLPTAALLQNGDVLVTGGYRYCGIGCFNGSTATAEIYHP